MTKTVRIENACTADKQLVARVYHKPTDPSEPHVLVSETRLMSPTDMATLTIHGSLYILIEEYEQPATQKDYGCFYLNQVKYPILDKFTNLTYEQIAQSCGTDPARNPSIMWTLGDQAKILSHGETLEVTDGVHIQCMVTGNA